MPDNPNILGPFVSEEQLFMILQYCGVVLAVSIVFSGLVAFYLNWRSKYPYDGAAAFRAGIRIEENPWPRWHAKFYDWFGEWCDEEWMDDNTANEQPAGSASI